MTTTMGVSASEASPLCSCQLCFNSYAWSSHASCAARSHRTTLKLLRHYTCLCTATTPPPEEGVKKAMADEEQVERNEEFFKMLLALMDEAYTGSAIEDASGNAGSDDSGPLDPADLIFLDLLKDENYGIAVSSSSLKYMFSVLH
ncbi:hypothetical protein E2562_033930 [Oryza meyeriana var. granulata]|uniref:Uncharacterized protein n=1 Tax=Oryza meyeriana var. granulata TaxID=110450 RepID=A0A6G1C215_9ORYZ|nr:hypothetical protein E2562_033930 [Oryza meyeriana var. granulata]